MPLKANERIEGDTYFLELKTNIGVSSLVETFAEWSKVDVYNHEMNIAGLLAGFVDFMASFDHE